VAHKSDALRKQWRGVRFPRRGGLTLTLGEAADLFGNCDVDVRARGIAIVRLPVRLTIGIFAESRPDARTRIAMALQPAGPFHGWIVSALDHLEPSPNRATADQSRPSSHLRSD